MGSKDSPLNFGAGPGKIPKQVLKEAQDEFLSYNNIGFSITELSHRSNEYANINQDAQNNLRDLLSIPENYDVLFVHGGGQGLFSAIAMNLMARNGSADYVITGIWSQIAANEAKKYGQVNFVFSKLETTADISDPKTWKLNSNASYVYYCDNETIDGIEFPFVPDTKGIPIVADMSSSIMTKKIDVSKFGVIIAAVHKNLGTAGIGIVIIRKDLLGHAMEMCPSILNFALLSKADSILNTPPIFSVYMLGKVLKWVKMHGGLEEMEKQCRKKSKLLYDTINSSSGFYKNEISLEKFRSRTNIPFRIKDGNNQLEEKFLKQAEERYMFQLKGHKLVGGIRVSLYNSVSYDDVIALVDFMKEFKEQNKD